MSVPASNSHNHTSSNSKTLARTEIKAPAIEEKSQPQTKPNNSSPENKNGIIKTIWNSITNFLKWLGRKFFPSSPKMRKIKTLVPNGKDDKGTELFEIREVTVPNKFVEKRSLHSCGGGCSSVGMGSHKTNTNDSSSGHGHGHDAGHSCGSHSCGAHGCGASCGAGCGAGCGGCGA